MKKYLLMFLTVLVGILSAQLYAQDDPSVLTVADGTTTMVMCRSTAYGWINLSTTKYSTLRICLLR